MLLLVIAAGTFLSTLMGGLLALRLRDRLHLILGFSAGAVIGGLVTSTLLTLVIVPAVSLIVKVKVASNLS